MLDDGEEVADSGRNAPAERRILKVRLRQDQVIRLHELRILEGKSIAALLEGILEDYLYRDEHAAPGTHNLPGPPPVDPPQGPA